MEACQKDASSAFWAKILCHCGGGIVGERVPKWPTECHLTCVSANEPDLKLGDTGTSWLSSPTIPRKLFSAISRGFKDGSLKTSWSEWGGFPHHHHPSNLACWMFASLVTVVEEATKCFHLNHLPTNPLDDLTFDFFPCDSHPVLEHLVLSFYQKNLVSQGYSPSYTFRAVALRRLPIQCWWQGEKYKNSIGSVCFSMTPFQTQCISKDNYNFGRPGCQLKHESTIKIQLCY